ncbi:MAG: hypothetical protein Q8L05_10875, partial [Actinomycetota bacterium]|nr:hypothetical protein [Actinomycetota bacterium]
LDEGLSDGSLVVRYPYFQTRDPIEDDEPGTYVQTDADSSTRPVTHGITASARSSVPCSMRVWS